MHSLYLYTYSIYHSDTGFCSRTTLTAHLQVNLEKRSSIDRDTYSTDIGQLWQWVRCGRAKDEDGQGIKHRQETTQETFTSLTHHQEHFFTFKMMNSHEDVEFTTIDGLTIRGWLYPAASRGPAVIITPGVSIPSF